MADPGPSYGWTHWRSEGDYYYTSLLTIPNATTMAIEASKIYAIPYPEGEVQRNVGNIALTVFTQHSGEYRLAIYAETGSNNPYPGGLIAETAPQSLGTGNGIKVASIDATLSTNRCLWLAVVFDSVADGTTCNAWNATNGWSPFPYTAVGNAPATVVVSYAFGAFPSTFPMLTSGATTDNNAPLLGIQYK